MNGTPYIRRGPRGLARAPFYDKIYQMMGRIVGVRSTEQFVWHLLTTTSIR